MEHTTEEISCSTSRLQEIKNHVNIVQSSEEIGVKYMQKWEEIAEARAEGRTEGREEYTLELIRKKQEKGKSLAQIAEDLEMTEEEIQSVLDRIKEEHEGQ